MLTISSSKDQTKIVEIFDSPSIQEELQKISTNLLIKINIEGHFNQLSQDELKILYLKCKEKSIVILISSKNDKNFFLYWKAKEAENFLMLVPYNDIHIENDKIYFEFVAEFLVKSLINGHFGKHFLIFWDSGIARRV